jgi:hypothetical protein
MAYRKCSKLVVSVLQLAVLFVQFSYPIAVLLLLRMSSSNSSRMVL